MRESRSETQNGKYVIPLQVFVVREDVIDSHTAGQPAKHCFDRITQSANARLAVADGDINGDAVMGARCLFHSSRSPWLAMPDSCGQLIILPQRRPRKARFLAPCTVQSRRGVDHRNSVGVRAWSIVTAQAQKFSMAGRQKTFAVFCLVPTVVGDLGLGAFASESVLRGANDSLRVLPYMFATYGRYFVGLDIFGIKTLPAGQGYLELVARINFDGFESDTPELYGMKRRANSLPLGVGTFQNTPVGDLFLNAFHDVNDSGGNIFEVIYRAKFAVGNMVVYPLFGAEYRDANYVSYYYGVSESESAASGKLEYQPDAALSPMVALQVEIPIEKAVRLNIFWRRQWLDTAIARSPIVASTTKDNGFVAVTYRFD